MLWVAFLNFVTSLIVEVSMTSINSGGVNQQAPIDYQPIEIDRVKSSMAPKVQELQNDFLARIDDLKAQIADDPRSKRAMELKGEITRLENAFRSFSNEVTNHVSQRGGITHLQEDSHRKPTSEIQGLVRGMQIQLQASYEAYGSASQGVTDRGDLDSLPVLEMRAPRDGLTQVPGMSKLHSIAFQRMTEGRGVEAPSTDNASEIDGASEGGETDEATAGTGMTAADLDVDRMVRLLSSDPQAFMEELRAIEDPSERAAAMSLMQNQLQQINQLFSMVSQFS